MRRYFQDASPTLAKILEELDATLAPLENLRQSNRMYESDNAAFRARIKLLDTALAAIAAAVNALPKDATLGDWKSFEEQLAAVFRRIKDPGSRKVDPSEIEVGWSFYTWCHAIGATETEVRQWPKENQPVMLKIKKYVRVIESTQEWARRLAARSVGDDTEGTN